LTAQALKDDRRARLPQTHFRGEFVSLYSTTLVSAPSSTSADAQSHSTSMDKSNSQRPLLSESQASELTLPLDMPAWERSSYSINARNQADIAREMSLAYDQVRNNRALTT